jgi:L-threonylcarbamoyladenylate synthase
MPSGSSLVYASSTLHMFALSKKLKLYIRRGGVIAYPTESCYGFGCDPGNYRAVLRILKLKQRPQHKGLILIASHYRQVAPFLKPITPADRTTLKNDGAKAVTYLMPVKPSCPRWLRGAHDTLAVRLTAHPFAAWLCNSVGSALVSTSANRSGQRATRTYAQCQRLFGRKVWVLPGRTGNRKKPSTIRAWENGQTIRE